VLFVINVIVQAMPWILHHPKFQVSFCPRRGLAAEQTNVVVIIIIIIIHFIDPIITQ
jgi:hypothetical protein